MTRDFSIFLFVLGLILFNWPLISMFGQDLLKYFFGVWFIYIIFILVGTRYKNKRDNGG